MWKYNHTPDLSHADRKKHKYIAKLDLKKYKRYFYSWDEYKSYLNKGKQKVGSLINKIKASIDIGTKFVKKTLNKISKKTVSELKVTENSVSFVANYLKDFGSEKILNIKPKKKYKYLYKEQIGPRKYRYFYDEKSHNVWLKKQKYIKNEPEFMKNIPKTKDITDPDAPVLMSADNSAKVNAGFWDSDTYTTNNCFFCTTAYELRQRGYDVKAKQTEQGTMGKEAYDIYKNPKIVTFSENVENNPEELKKQLVEKSGPGSRGNICIKLKPYGGHSMAYEISPDGNDVVIVDTQSNENFHLAYVASRIDAKPASTKAESSMFFRTDNLELKKDILNLVQPVNSETEVVTGEEDSISDRKSVKLSNYADKDVYKEFFDENGNPSHDPERIYPEGYDEAKIKVTWG